MLRDSFLKGSELGHPFFFPCIRRDIAVFGVDHASGMRMEGLSLYRSEKRIDVCCKMAMQRWET